MAAIINLLGISMANIPVEDILMVELLKNVIVFGFKVNYKKEIGQGEIVIRSWGYKKWGEYFRQLGIKVIKPTGWI